MSIHFIVPPAYVDEFCAVSDMKLGGNFPYWTGGRFVWVAQSYLMLRQFREGITMGSSPLPGQVNFRHSMEWRDNPRRIGEFRVSFRADYPRLYDVDFEILQNPAVPVGPNQAYLPFWPVPGQISRDHRRRGVSVIGYAGRLGPLNLVRNLVEGVDDLKAFDFQIIPPQKWHDLSQVDVLIGVRNFDRMLNPNKPPSKLFAAWRAEIPLIAGYDSAFSHIAVPGEEYLRVDSLKNFTNSVRQLADDTVLYNDIVEAGRVRAPECSHEAIAQIWLNCIDTAIVPKFEAWKALGSSGLASATHRTIDRMRNGRSAVKRAISRK